MSDRIKLDVGGEPEQVAVTHSKLFHQARSVGISIEQGAGGAEAVLIVVEPMGSETKIAARIDSPEKVFALADALRNASARVWPQAFRNRIILPL